VKWAGIIECEGCALISADPGTLPEHLEQLYGEAYFHGTAYGDYELERPLIERNFGLRLRRLERYLDADRHRSLLEIGCAYGFFMDTASKRFERVIGVDVAEAAVQSAASRGLDANAVDILTWVPPVNPVDVVCMWDTIEHLAHPAHVIARAAELTAPGALLCVTTGDIGSTMARIRGRRWRMIGPPEHAWYFSRSTLTRLLDEHGFDVVDISACGFYRSADFAAHYILSRRGHTELLAFLRRTHLINWSMYSNLGDVMYVIARRR